MPETQITIVSMHACIVRRIPAHVGLTCGPEQSQTASKPVKSDRDSRDEDRVSTDKNNMKYVQNSRSAAHLPFAVSVTGS